MKMTFSGKNKPAKPTINALFSIADLCVQQVFIADVGDGAFLDDAVKIKPNRHGPGIVMKCIDSRRLKIALQRAGYDPEKTKIVRGRKHFIAFIETDPGMMSLPAKAGH